MVWAYRTKGWRNDPIKVRGEFQVKGLLADKVAVSTVGSRTSCTNGLSKSTANILMCLGFLEAL